MEFEADFKDIGSVWGGDLDSKELQEDIVSVYDVPKDKALEFAVSTTNYEGSSLQEIMVEGFTKSSPDLAFYKITDVPAPVKK